MKTRKVTGLPHQDTPVGIEYNAGTNLGNWDRNRTEVKHVVIHTIVGTIQGAMANFKQPEKRSSAHYGIGLDGTIYNWINEDLVAYHATNYDMNRKSIGIEHEDGYNPTTRPNAHNEERPDALYIASARLVRDICDFYGLPIDNKTIIPHKQVAATACPSSLDIDRIISMAKGLGAPIDTIQPLDNSGEVSITKHELNALQVLREINPNVTTDSGEPYGNTESLVRALYDTYVSYKKVFVPDTKGNPPVVIPSEVFLELSIKAKNLDEVSDYLAVGKEVRINPAYGQVLIDLYNDLSMKKRANIELEVNSQLDKGHENINPINSVKSPVSNPRDGVPIIDNTSLNTSNSPKNGSTFGIIQSILNLLKMFTKPI